MTAFELSTATAGHRFLGMLLGVSLIVVAALTAARFSADRFYYGDLVTFFLPALFAMSVAAAVLSIAAGHRIFAVIALAIAVFNGLPLFLPTERAAATANGRELRVATSNILGNRSDFGDLIAWSTNSGIDVLGQQEVGASVRQLGALRDHFSATLPPELFNRHPEVMAWSNWQVVKGERVKDVPKIPYSGWGGSPVRLELAPPGTPISPDDPTYKPTLVVYVVHPATPRSFGQWEFRNTYLDAVARSIASESSGTPIVVMGDFNTPTWSPFFQSFLKRTGLVDAAGTGWPATTRFSRRFAEFFHFGSPIDHILVSPSIEVKRFELGPDVGSDHFPVFADLRLP